MIKFVHRTDSFECHWIICVRMDEIAAQLFNVCGRSSRWCFVSVRVTMSFFFFLGSIMLWSIPDNDVQVSSIPPTPLLPRRQNPLINMNICSLAQLSHLDLGLVRPACAPWVDTTPRAPAEMCITVWSHKSLGIRFWLSSLTCHYLLWGLRQNLWLPSENCCHRARAGELSHSRQWPKLDISWLGPWAIYRVMVLKLLHLSEPNGAWLA